MLQQHLALLTAIHTSATTPSLPRPPTTAGPRTKSRTRTTSIRVVGYDEDRGDEGQGDEGAEREDPGEQGRQGEDEGQQRRAPQGGIDAVRVDRSVMFACSTKESIYKTEKYIPKGKHTCASLIIWLIICVE